MLRPWILVAAILAPQEPSPPLASGLVRSLELESPHGTCVQHFRVDREGARADELPLALLRYVAGPDPAGGVHADLEVLYPAEDLRVIHTEQATRTERRVVFRELHERAGRTLFLERRPEGGFEGYELGGREVVHRALATGGELPLLLIESARLGIEPPAETAVLDPLAGAFEPLRLSARVEEDARVFEARRADGSLRWRVLVRGERLDELRFQERGPAARAIEAEEYERLRSAHEDAARVREADAEPRRAVSPRLLQTGYR